MSNQIRPKLSVGEKSKSESGYQWEVDSDDDEEIKLGPDIFAEKLNNKVIHYHKPGQKAKKLILKFPWWLWEPVNWWWSRLRWTPKGDHKNIGASNAGKAKKKVTCLELVIDF